MNPTRRWILAGLIATLGALLVALLANGFAAATVEPLLEEPTESAATPAFDRPSSRTETTPDRKPLAAPPASSRRAARGPVLLAGRTIDDLGDAVEDATVTASAWWERGARSPDISDEDWYRGLRELNQQRRAQTNLTVVQSAGGRFEVRGWTSATRVELVAGRGKQRTTRICAIGARGLVVMLGRIGRVDAVLLHDRGISARSFELSLVSHGESPPIELKIARYTGQGSRTFRCEKTPMGIYALEVRLADHDTPLLRLGGIDVRADELCQDERLQHIDTRSLLRRMVVRLLRPNGQSLPLPAYFGAEVMVLDPNGEPLPVQPELRKSRIELTTRYPYVDLTVNVPRYRGLHLPVLSASCEVHLEDL